MKKRWLTRSILLMAVLTFCLFSSVTDVHAAEKPQYTATSIEEVISIVRDRAKVRAGDFMITYLSETTPSEFDGYAVLQQIEDGLFAHTGVGDEGDYIRWHNLWYNCTLSYSTADPQNGLYTYSREPKFSEEIMAKMKKAMIAKAEMEKIK